MAIFKNFALVQNENFVIVDDSLETMRNGDGRVLDLADGLLDLGVGRVVDGGGGFVHEQDLGGFQESSCEAEKLSLAL